MARRFASLPTASILGVELPVATTRRSRLLGLARLSAADAGPGLLLPGCRSIHTFGMRFPIDVAFLDARGLELKRCRAVPPRRFLLCRRARAVAELVPPAGGEQAPAGH